MARIRTIKPEFFTSEDIVALSPLARLLYIATWCEADKEGRLAWKPATFKLRYLPGESCDVHALCAELVDSGLVVLYGDGLAYIPKFSQHQHINPRESDSKLPEPEKISRDSDASARVIDAQGGREGKGKERKGKDSVPTGTDAAPAPSPMTDEEIIFAYGVPMLTNAGTADKQARSFLGGLRKAHGDPAVVDALRQCARAKPLQPIEWLAKLLPPRGASPPLNRQEALEARNRSVADKWAEEMGFQHASV